MCVDMRQRTVYELNHLFYRWDGEIVSSPKNLGFYDTLESAQSARADYLTRPGFQENPDGFSIRARSVAAGIQEGVIFEALVYFHTEDYEFETDVELGLYGCAAAAEEAVRTYCQQNAPLLHVQGITCEQIVNRCVLNKREWEAGFLVG